MLNLKNLDTTHMEAPRDKYKVPLESLVVNGQLDIKLEEKPDAVWKKIKNKKDATQSIYKTIEKWGNDYTLSFPKKGDRRIT